ncbi:MAG: hypothetical protein U9R29_08725 [Thermodesulfobacteriota bacterium]|nr:hypothetical protein [Thermodesulfobacteriota bacterium]
MKIIAKFLIFIIIIAIIALAGTTYYLDSIAKKAVEFGGSKALGVDTTIDKLHISLLDGSSSFKGFSIANPQGFSDKNFMELTQAKIAIDIRSLLSDTVHISEISLSGLQLGVEQSNQSSNVKSLLANIPRAKKSQPKEKTPKTTSSPSSDSGKKFIVDRIVLEDIGVTAKLQALGNQLSDVSLTVPRIELSNVGQQQGGMMMAELIQYVVEQVLNKISNNSNNLSPALAAMLQGDLASVDSLKAGAMRAASDEIDKASKKLLKELDLPEGSDTQLQQAADTLIKGLFNNK